MLTIATLPSPLEDVMRISHTRLRRRILYSEWKQDVLDRIAIKFKNIRAALHDCPDMSRNPAGRAAEVRAALYDEAPKVTNKRGGQADVMSEILETAGVWPMMQTVQRDTLGLREMLVRVDASKRADGGIELVTRSVFPDQVLARAAKNNPRRPVEIRELIDYRDELGNVRWVWEVWNIEDPQNPFHKVLSADIGNYGADISSDYGLPSGGAKGKVYPCWFGNGTPYLPYVVYHAKLTSKIFDPRAEHELFEGTLNVAVLWTQYDHIIRNAAWKQKYYAGLKPKGKSAIGRDGKRTKMRTVVADPSNAIEFEYSEEMPEGAQALIGQWDASSDPEKVAASIIVYERGLAEYAGLDPAEMQRASGDPRSGYAIAVSIAGKARQQRRYAPVFRLSDIELLAVIAARWNAAAGGRIVAEDGWGVQYIAADASIDPMTGEPIEATASSTAATTTPADGADPATPAAPAQGTPVAVADTALNGAQVTAAVDSIIDRVIAGRMGKASAKAQLRIFYRLKPQDVDDIVDPLEVVGPAAAAPPAQQFAATPAA